MSDYQLGSYSYIPFTVKLKPVIGNTVIVTSVGVGRYCRFPVVDLLPN